MKQPLPALLFLLGGSMRIADQDSNPNNDSYRAANGSIMHGTDSEGKRIIHAIPNDLAGTDKAAFWGYIKDGQFAIKENIDMRFYMGDISDRGYEGTCEQYGKNYDKKSRKFIWIGIVLIIALSGIFIVISVNMNGNDMTQAEEQKSINVDVNNGQDMLSNPEAELSEQENEIGEINEKVYEDKFVDLNIEYLGSGKSSKEKHVQKTTYEDGEECALTGYHIFQSEWEYEREAELWDIHDLDFVLDIDENNYYIVIYGKRICWMQYNPGSMSQFGGVEYRIGVDWESDIEKGTFFFCEIDGEQIERGYLPEEITLEF